MTINGGYMAVNLLIMVLIAFNLFTEYLGTTSEDIIDNLGITTLIFLVINSPGLLLLFTQVNAILYIN